MLPGATVPVWLENVGLRNVDARLTQDESVQILKQLARYADALMDPKAAKE